MIIEIQHLIDLEVKQEEQIVVVVTPQINLLTIEMHHLAKKEVEMCQLKVKREIKAKNDLNTQAGLIKENTTKITRTRR